MTQFVTVISLFYYSIANSSISSFSNGYALFCLSHTPSLLLISPLHSHTFFVILLHSQSLFSLFYHQPTSPTTARGRHLSQGGLSFYCRLEHRVKGVATGLNCWTDFFPGVFSIGGGGLLDFKLKVWHKIFQLYGYSPSKNVWENEIRDPSQDERWKRRHWHDSSNRL